MKLLGFWAVNQPGSKRTKDKKVGREGRERLLPTQRRIREGKAGFLLSKKCPFSL